MKQNFTMEGLQNLLFFPFKDQYATKKLVVASLKALAGFVIPILPWLFLLGYSGTIMRQIIVNREEPRLPEWENWSSFLSLGARMFAVNFIYGLPVIVPVILGYSLMILPAFMDGFFGTPYDSYSHPGNTISFMMLGTFGGMALFGLGMFFGLLLWIILPPALGHVVAKDSFAAGFHIRDWWKIFRANVGGYILALVLAAGLYMALMLVIQVIYMTIILCALLPFLLAFVSAYLSIIVFTLFAQAYSDGLIKLEAKTA